MNGRLPVVRADPAYSWNTTFHFDLISKIYAQNVVFWPLDIRNPGSDFAAVYRGGLSRPLDR